MHRLQMRHTAVHINILEMNEPVFPLRRIYPAALMRSIDLGISLMQNDLLFIRPLDLPGTQDQLPARLDPACRTHDIIISVSLIEFRAFCGWMPVFLTEYLDAAVDDLRAFRIHAVQIQARGDRRPASRPGMYQVDLPIIIKQYGRINPSCLIRSMMHPPGTCRILRGKDKQAFIRRTYIDIERAFMITNTRRPCPLLVIGSLIRRKWQRLRHIPDMLPMHEIRGMQHGNSGKISKR